MCFSKNHFILCILSDYMYFMCATTPMTVAHHAPLSMKFFRQEYSIGLPFPTAGTLPDPGIKPVSLACLHLEADSLLLSHLGSSALPLLHPTNFDESYCKHLIQNTFQTSWDLFYPLVQIRWVPFIFKYLEFPSSISVIDF